MNNQVSFTSLSGTAPTCGKADTDGIIKLPAGSGERWAVLLPQSAVAGGQAYTEDNHYYGTRSAVPAIKANDYLSNGIAVNVEATYPSLPGEFTVDESGKTVHFSSGNLQYQASTGTWRFAEHQYTYIGNAAGNNTSDLDTRTTQSDWIDLFGFGTSGWNNGATYYQPYDIDGNSYSYTTNSLTGDYARADWGVYNAISNGGNKAGIWRVLTKDEWVYLINTRTTSTVNGVANARYAKATVNSLTGLILFPDNYTHPSGIPSPTNINIAEAAFTGNMYTSLQWEFLESVGAVFLPGAGIRSGATVTADGYGRYSSSTVVGNQCICALCFNTNLYVTDGSWETFRSHGLSVRLVHE